MRARRTPATSHAARRPLAPIVLSLAVLAGACGAVATAGAAGAVRSGPQAQSTSVFFADFDTAIPPEISAPGAVLSGVEGYAGLGPSGNTFGGQFLRYVSVPLYDTRLVVRGLPAHDHLSLEFLFAVIDSWDGTELFRVSVDGQLLFNHWFQLATGDSSSYIAPPGGLLSRGTNLGFSAGGYWSRDRAYDMSVEPAFHDIPHTADSVVVVWSIGAVAGPAADQWQGGTDESWAIDNVRITVANGTLGVGAGAPPRTALALSGAQPNPARGGRLDVRFSLPDAAPARLELYDISGRRVAARDVGALGAGPHAVDLGEGVHVAPGLYLVRLTRDGEQRSARVVVTS